MSIPSNSGGFLVGPGKSQSVSLSSTSASGDVRVDITISSGPPPVSALKRGFQKAKEIDWGTCALRAALFTAGVALAGTAALVFLGTITTPVGIAISVTIGLGAGLLAANAAADKSRTQEQYRNNLAKEISMIQAGLNVGMGALLVTLSAAVPFTAWSALGITYGSAMIIYGAGKAHDVGLS